MEEFLAGLNKKFSTQDKRDILDAYHFAKKAHAGQRRKTGEDYITHPVAVAEFLLNYGTDKETIIAGLLHDVVEDTPIEYKEILDKFGKNVAFLVDGVTKEEGRTQEKIKAKSLINKRVLLVKLADRIHNLTTPINSKEWRIKYYNSTKEYYIPIAKEFGFDDLAERLEKLLPGFL